MIYSHVASNSRVHVWYKSNNGYFVRADYKKHGRCRIVRSCNASAVVMIETRIRFEPKVRFVPKTSDM